MAMKPRLEKKGPRKNSVEDFVDVALLFGPMFPDNFQVHN
jgi:hypothetical protein